jgi:hypothetical protein
MMSSEHLRLQPCCTLSAGWMFDTSLDWEEVQC